MVKYTNSFDEPISYEKAIAAADYNELHYDDGEVKIAYRYTNGHLEFINYYKAPGEYEKNIIPVLAAKCERFSISDRKRAGDYFIEEQDEYAGNTLIFKNRYLVNKKAAYLCWETLDLLTGQPVYKKTKKYLFDDDKEEILEGFYNADGSLDHIIYKPLGDHNSG